MKRRVVSRTGTVPVAETLCGRHVEVSRIPAQRALRSCETCKRIARAE